MLVQSPISAPLNDSQVQEKSPMKRVPSESCFSADTTDSSDSSFASTDSSDESDDLEKKSTSCGTDSPKPPTRVVRRRSSIRSFNPEEIPIKSRGWKTLPRPSPIARASTAPSPRTSSSPSSSTNSVSFHSVEFRCFEQCAGDNPSVSIGTPISLDWTFEDMEAIALDAYEESRGQRRTPRQLMMNYFQRRTLLSYRYGLTEDEMNAAEKAANTIRNQRALTRALLPTSLLEDLVTSAARKTKRAISRKTPEDDMEYTYPSVSGTEQQEEVQAAPNAPTTTIDPIRATAKEQPVSCKIQLSEEVEI